MYPKTCLTNDKPLPPKEIEAVAPLESAHRATEQGDIKENTPSDTPVILRPSAPIPTRSTLAQSSFSWMLESDESVASRTPPSAYKTLPTQQRKRLSNNASRERNAFLFGEATVEAFQKADDIFGMEPIQKSKNKS